MITIYGKDKKAKHEKLTDIPFGNGSIRRYNLMKEDYILLKFSLDENIPLVIGDYVDLTDASNQNDQTTKLFVVDRNYYPTYNKETGGWDYSVQMNAFYYQWKNRVFMYNPSKGAAEASFSLTDTIEKHVELVISNLNGKFDYKGTAFESEVNTVEDKGLQPITYSSVTIFGALDAIANAFGCEWWVVENVIHFGLRKNEGESMPLTLNEEIDSASTSNASGTHATRLYAFGGTTNVPKHYRDKLEFTVTKISGTKIQDENHPVKASYFRKKNRKPSVTKTKSYNANHLYLDPAFPQKKVHGSVTDVVINSSKMYCVYKGDATGFEQDVTAKIDLYLSDSVNTKTIATFTNTFRVGDVDYKTNSIQVDSIKRGFIAYDGSRFRTDVDDPKHFLLLYKVNKGKSYRIGCSVPKNSQKTLLFAFHPTFEGTVYLDGYSDYSTYQSGMYTGYAYNMPSDGYLCVCFDINVLDGLPTLQAVYNLVNVTEFASASVSVKSENKIDFQNDSDVEYYPYSFVKTGFAYEAGKSFSLNDNKELVEKTETGASIIACNAELLSSFTIEYQEQAYSASTIIRYQKGVDKEGNPNFEEKEVTVNPNFEDNGTIVAIDDKTMPLKVGDKYTFPDILISKVPDIYFEAEDGGVQTGVVQRNVMLPKGTDYVQVEGVDDSDAVEAIVVYDWIYPKTELEVADKYEYPEEVEEEDGSKYTRTRYKIQINIGTWDEEIMLGDKLYAIFQTNKMAGARVEITHIEDDWFLIEPNEDYTLEIPNSALYPQEGDKLILDGIDVSFIDAAVIQKAENEVLEQANKDILETSKENIVADITLYSDIAYNRGRLALGSLVTLKECISKDFDSRIIGFEEKLDIPYDSPKYIVGDSNYYSAFRSIESKLNEIKKESSIITGTGTTQTSGGTSVNIIKSKDSTKASDSNVYSALRTDENFLHTKEDDIVEGNITFNKNVDVKGTAKAKTLNVSGDASVGGTSNVGELNVEGNADVGGNQSIQGSQTIDGLQTLKGGMQTEVFSNAAGSVTGAQLTANGIFSAAGIVANSFKIHELIYNVIRANGGKQVLSNSATVESCRYKLKGITDLVDTYTGGTENLEYVLLTIKADENNKGANPFKAGDILYGYVNNIGASGEISTGGECTMHVIEEPNAEAPMVVKVAMYEVRNDIDINNSTYYDYVSSNIAPTPSMALAQRGSITDETRRTSIFLDAESGNIIMLQNVSTPRIKKEYYGTLNGKLPKDLYDDIKKAFTGLRTTDPVMFAKYGVFQNIIQYDHQGQFIQTERNRGIWSNVGVYENNASYYDVVSYQGQLWKCVAESGSTTNTPPSSDNQDWLLLVAKGDDGTSIKVSGSYDSEDSLKNPDGSWREPSDASECYIISGYLYVWIPAQGGQSGFWKNVGQFKGDRGDSVTGTTIQYAVNQSMTQRPSDSEFNDNYPSSISQGDVLWERTKVNVENHVTEWSYTASRQAKDGEHGKGIKSAMPPKYAKTQTAQQPDINSSVWKSSIAELEPLEQGSYIWTATIIDYEDDNIDDTVSISVSRVGERGESIKTTGTYYHTSSDGINVPSGTWLEYIPEVNEGEYLWTRIDFSDNTSAYSVSKNGVSIKVSEIKYSTKFTATQPNDSTFTLNNPPTNIPEGGFLWSRTTFSDGNKVYSYAYQGMDNTSIQWSLLTNTNRINVSDRENSSQNYIDVRVGKTTAQGYTEITDSNTLSNEGYKVMYYIDGAINSAKSLVLQSNEAYIFDDGTELVLEDDANIPLVVENTVIDLFSVRQSVTFILVPSGVSKVTEADIEASTEVLVINSDNTLSIEMSDSMIGVQVDAEGKKATSSNTYIAEGQVKLGGKVKPLSSVLLRIVNPDVSDPNYSNTYEIQFAEYVEPDGKTFGVQIYIPSGSSMSSVPKYIEVEASLKADDSYKATARISMQGLRRGEVGKNGEQGAMVIPYGFWDKDARDANSPSYAYRLIVSNGVVIGRPMVYNGTDCYILQKDIEVSKNTEANLTNTIYWAKMQQFDYVFTKALMADFANLASAIFFRRYMFSEMGIDMSTGESQSWEGHAGDMFFEENGQDKLKGEYVPKLFLDFVNGGAKFAKLSESFIRIPVDAVMYNMNMDESHNISASRRDNGLPVVVTLPSSITDNAQSSWSEDGTHCTITYEYDSEYKMSVIKNSFSNKVMVICSDYRFFTNYESKESYLANIERIKGDNNGWMIWKGQRCKFVVLSAGSILKLRSLKCEDGELYWFIENSSDFDELEYETGKITIYRSYDSGEGHYGEVYRSTDGMNDEDKMSLGLLIGSPTVNWYENKRWILSADGIIKTEETYVLAE